MQGHTSFLVYLFIHSLTFITRGDRPGGDRMVIGFTATCTISAGITTDVVGSNPTHGEVYAIQHYM